MRILRVAQHLYPETKGGGAYHVHAMSRDQAAMGHEVTVLTIGPGPSVEQRSGYTIIRQPATTSLFGNEISTGVAQFLHHTDEFDLIHAHSHLYFSTNLAAFKCTFDDTPFALTNHGLYSQTVPEWLFDAYLRTAGKWSFNAADTIFCYTETDQERLRDRDVKAPITVVHNGIDTARFTPDGTVHSSVAGKPSILFVGRLVAGKRPSDALAAFSKLRKVIPEAELVFCGDGPLRAELEDMSQRLGIRDDTRFLGHVSYDEMPAVYRGGDLLVLPSRAEGLPRTVLEALASGCPVVASDLPQIQEVVNKAGKTVPVGDVGRLADALQILVADPERRRNLGKNGRRHVVENYAWEETVAQTTEQLKSLVTS